MGTTIPKIEPFELYSDAYDEWFRKNAEKYESELEVIRGLLPTYEVKGVEIGVGSGKFAGPLGIKLGVEPSRKMAHSGRIRKGCFCCNQGLKIS